MKYLIIVYDYLEIFRRLLFCSNFFLSQLADKEFNAFLKVLGLEQ